VRIHRNCLVAKEAIMGFEKNVKEEGGWLVKLTQCHEPLPISRRQQHLIKDISQ